MRLQKIILSVAFLGTALFGAGCVSVPSPQPVPRTEEGRILEKYRRPWAYTRDRSGRYRWTNRPAEPIEYGEK
jgi:hypothetical protein